MLSVCVHASYLKFNVFNWITKNIRIYKIVCYIYANILRPCVYAVRIWVRRYEDTSHTICVVPANFRCVTFISMFSGTKINFYISDYARAKWCVQLMRVREVKPMDRPKCSIWVSKKLTMYHREWSRKERMWVIIGSHLFILWIQLTLAKKSNRFFFFFFFYWPHSCHYYEWMSVGWCWRARAHGIHAAVKSQIIIN